TRLVEPGHVSLSRAVELLATRPASILGLPDQGSLEVGSHANLVVFDPGARWSVDANALQSKSRNTPFEGRQLSGRVLHTLFKGVPTVRDSRPVEEVLV
ncbi:MAG: amidohydrolase family protein, partial [Actinomycetota bacterium]|nr:amidohydrolase family protein [Actinomycetota bacterium]